MNVETLSEYIDLLAEEKDIKARIDRTENNIKALGTGGAAEDLRRRRDNLNRYRLELITSKNKVADEIKVISGYINNISDTRLKRIFVYRFIKGLSWVQVAYRMGGVHTAEGCRKSAVRFLQASE